MAISTFEGIVENGQIRLRDGVTLPEHARVYVIIPESAGVSSQPHVHSPRLARPEQAADFAKQIVETDPDAGL